MALRPLVTTLDPQVIDTAISFISGSPAPLDQVAMAVDDFASYVFSLLLPPPVPAGQGTPLAATLLRCDQPLDKKEAIEVLESLKPGKAKAAAGAVPWLGLLQLLMQLLANLFPKPAPTPAPA